jgi:hypothetical protein
MKVMTRKDQEKGQAFLSLVLLVGGAMILIGLTLAFLATSFVDTGYGYQALTQAEAIATSGVEDALLQLDRNPNFGNTTGYSYTLPVASSTAMVTVTQSDPSAGFVTILSSATVGNRTRNVTVIAAVNASTSQVSVVSWQITQ